MGTPSEEIVEVMDAADVSEVADDFADSASFKTSLHTNPVFLAKVSLAPLSLSAHLSPFPRSTAASAKWILRCSHLHATAAPSPSSTSTTLSMTIARQLRSCDTLVF